MVALLTVRLLSGVVPPTAAGNVTTPPVPAVKTRACDPSIVLEKEMFAPAGNEFVVLAVTLFVKETGPVIPITLPLVVKLPFSTIDVPV